MSAVVQEARKKMQLRRLAEKERAGEDPEGYATYYANQPLQLVKAARNKIFADANAALRRANEVLAVAEIDGDGLKAAQEVQAIAAIVVEKSRPPRPGAHAGLTAAGSGV